MTSYAKDPNAVLDYGWDWSTWLAVGESITASTWVVDPDEPDGGLVIDDDSQFEEDATTVWVSAGTAGVNYRLTNHITTDGGRENDQSHEIIVKDL